MLLELKFVCPCRCESEKIFMKLHLRFAIVIVVWLQFLTVSLTFVLLNSVGWIGDIRTASSSKNVHTFVFYCIHIIFVSIKIRFGFGIWSQKNLEEILKFVFFASGAVEKRREEEKKKKVVEICCCSWWWWVLNRIKFNKKDFFSLAL